MPSSNTMTDGSTDVVTDALDVAGRDAAAPRGPDTVDTAPRRAAESARAELRAMARAARGMAARTARHAATVAERRIPALGTADDRWWEPAGSRVVRRARALVRTSAPPTDDTEAPGRRRLRWGQALAVGVTAFSVWVVFDAPTLLRSAQASPYGARRSAAITMLRPIAALSHDLGLSHVVGAADRLMGRNGGTVLQVGPQVPRRHTGRAAHIAMPTPKSAPSSGLPATDALPPLPVPTPAAPLRVLSVGDSLGVDFGGPFVNDLAATGVVNAVLDAHIDTGLARPDYFDWPAEVQADLAKYQPQAVVVFLGANDPQPMVQGGAALAYGTAAWSDAYAGRVGSLMQEITASGARVLWVGMPPMADPTLNAKMQVLDGIYQSQSGAHPGVTYVSSWPVLSDPQGAYAQFLPDASGNQVDVREPDGTHVSPGGAERLSEAVIDAMDRTWGLTLHP